MAIPKKDLVRMISAGMREHGLTPKQAETAIRYTLDPDLIGNKTRTALETYNTNDDNIALQLANSALGKPKVQTYIASLLESKGMGIEVRSELLADIATGRTKNTKTLTMRNSAGEVTGTQEIESNTPVSVRLRAIAHADKIDGTTDTAAATVRVAEAEYSIQRNKLLREAGR